MGDKGTFSESWHRIAGLKVSLRATVRVRKQRFRGEIWYLLHDRFNNSFFRVRPDAYRFLLRLGPNRTVEEVWKESLTLMPEGAPGQEEVLSMLTQLYYANLLYFDMPADTEGLFKRYSKRRQREIRSRFMSIMFMRIPLVDPDAFLKRIASLLRAVISPAGALVWGLVVALAIKAAVDNSGQLVQQVEGILAPDNLFLLYTGLVIVKTLHEVGHAAVCRRFGGEVHTMGVMLLVFTPLPYMDATSSWSFRNRWERALVGAAGMITELFVAAIATFVWARTGQGALHSLAYNIMFIASVSTLIFNANPLLRFDGYYILSDAMDIPNLSTRATQQLRHLCETYLFGCRDSTGSAETRKEAVWLSVFGVASGIYRVIVFVGIIFFVADKFLLAGLIMAGLCIFSWGVVPLSRFAIYLASSPRLARTRPRAVGVAAGGIAILVIFLSVVPFPSRFRAPGILESTRYTQVVSEAPGTLQEVLAPTGSHVKKGDPLLRMADPELEMELRRTRAQAQETKALLKQAMSRDIADLLPLKKRMDSIRDRQNRLAVQEDELVVKALQDGIWVAPRSMEMVGAWLPKGTFLGELVDPTGFRFSTIVAQDDASNLFEDRIRRAEVRLYGQEGRNIDVVSWRIIPFEQARLPSAALGWFGGGDVAVSTTDETGTTAMEPFFQIYADLSAAEGVRFLQGRSGRLRFTMDSEPLMVQGWRRLRQLLQKRYRL